MIGLKLSFDGLSRVLAACKVMPIKLVIDQAFVSGWASLDHVLLHRIRGGDNARQDRNVEKSARLHERSCALAWREPIEDNAYEV
jgi:hypothetical protein